MNPFSCITSGASERQVPQAGWSQEHGGYDVIDRKSCDLRLLGEAAILATAAGTLDYGVAEVWWNECHRYPARSSGQVFSTCRKRARA
jgi:hypothetical protein